MPLSCLMVHSHAGLRGGTVGQALQGSATRTEALRERYRVKRARAARLVGAGSISRRCQVEEAHLRGGRGDGPKEVSSQGSVRGDVPAGKPGRVGQGRCRPPHAHSDPSRLRVELASPILDPSENTPLV